MPLYKVTVKRTTIAGGIHLESGMSVNISCSHFSCPLSQNSGKEVNDAFIRVFGIDLKKAGALNSSFLNVLKIN